MLDAGLALTVLFQVSLGLVLILAGSAKLREGTAAVVTVVDDYALLPRVAVRPVAVLLPIVELTTGSLLLVGWRGAAVSAGALFTLFGLGIAINLLRHRSEIDCGCFGSGHERGLTWWLVVRNAGFATAAAAVATAQHDFSWSSPRHADEAIVSGGALVALVLLTTFRNLRKAGPTARSFDF